MGAATYVWRRLDVDGLVFVRPEVGIDEVVAQGQQICADGDDRWAARFSITLDARWRHRRTTIEVVDDAGTKRLELSSADGDTWTRNGQPDPSLAGCWVVDLAGNPFTNALVTRTAASGVGADVEVRAVFVETPALSVRPVVQRYRRLGDDRWLYADDEYGRFEFTTDADGIAVDYERLARRL